MSDKGETAKRASLAAVTEMMSKAGAPSRDLASLLENGTRDGDQLLLALAGSPACVPREDGRLGVMTSAGARGDAIQHPLEPITGHGSPRAPSLPATRAWQTGC